ncbi:FAD binding domain-containing protein [Alicyclobacillus dauci]|uniref:FAD binding domain-containing protein n=1 Tax=Alicyclobacillus dauci TaxID=1475485 RepID=A0ABY6Z7R0_9BACL|nr:FAD binding domain-containing protein [Alicyclobacillus dauci]WAH38728.1 FAD binding domain-containing protein [Alicyclobacillus dauci]
MIPLDFDYVRPGTLREAIDQFTLFRDAGLKPIYYAGGTEIITLARLGQIQTNAVIDIKTIPQTQVIHMVGQRLYLGAAITLSEVTDHPLVEREFPLLKVTASEIADRTARNKITLGGNICGEIIYREAILPLLLCDSLLRTVGPTGVRELNVMDLDGGSIKLLPGEFVVQIETNDVARKAPFVHIKRRKMGHVGYPIVTAAGIRVHNQIRTAFSGVCSFPFRSTRIEAELNREDIDFRQRIENALRLIPREAVLDDFEASRDYRLFVLRTALNDILEQLGGT